MKIRFTEVNDLYDIVEIDKKSSENGGLSIGNLVAFIGDVGTRAYTIEEGVGNVIGFALIRFEEDSIFIERLCVSADYRRHGFGTRILEKLTEVMESHEKRALRAIINEIDEASYRFWSKMGATPKLVKGHFGDRNGYEFTLEGGVEL